MEWVQDTVLPAVRCNSSKPSNYAVYRELDDLNKRESALQAHLYQQLQQFDPSAGEGFFYDITSTYMEGSNCVISKLGYSRDHRPDLQQIVIALMVTPLGSPFYWKVLEGNTQDVTTLPDVVKDLKNRFGLTRCHLVLIATSFTPHLLDTARTSESPRDHMHHGLLVDKLNRDDAKKSRNHTIV